MTNEPHLRDRVQKCWEAEEVESSGFPSPSFSRCLAAWRPKRISRVFDRVQRQFERAHSFLQVAQESLRLMLMLKADNGVIRIADGNHVAGRLSQAPAMGPEIEHVVQVDVRKNW